VSDPWDSYRWVNDVLHELDAYCVTAIEGAWVDRVIDVFACDRGSRRDATFAEQLEMSLPYPEGWGNDTIQIDELEGYVVCMENNGWAGTEEPRPQQLSSGGLYAAVYRNVNAVMQVVVARGGNVQRVFDPLLYDSDGALPEEAGLPFGDPARATAAMWTLLGRVTGLQLSRQWLLAQRHPAYLRDPAPPAAA
jgi:hypothetical protein